MLRQQHAQASMSGKSAQQSLIGLSEMTVWALIVGQTTCPQNAKRPRAWQGRL